MLRDWRLPIMVGLLVLFASLFLHTEGFAQTSPTPQMISENLSPRIQVFNGVAPDDVICKSGLELIFKYNNGNPTCVKPETAKRLLDVKWATKHPFEQARVDPALHDKTAGWLFRYCDKTGGKFFQPFHPERGPLCNLRTSDLGMECTNSSQCESYCQAKVGAEIGSVESGLCYGYQMASCMQEVRNGVVDPMWCM